MPSQPVKRIVCLASSRMPRGRCIAGKELLLYGRPGGWIRPINGREGEGVSISESRYIDGDIPSLLDVMDVPVLQWQPENHQRENWLIDLNRRWSKVSLLAPSHLPNCIDEVDTLWVNGHSSSVGQNDRVTALDTKSLRNSLYLIETNLTLRVFKPYDDRQRVQGQFGYNGIDY